MTSTFDRLHPRLRDGIGHRLGWTGLRPVQEEAGQALLDGENAVVLAPTAGGKTEASMFPVLSGLLENPTNTLGALYIAPIKALLNNQAERLGMYTEMVGLERQVWHGDTPAGEKKRFLHNPCELLMTTPESLEVMLVSPRVPSQRIFEDVRIIVIDEIHALAGSDRGAHLMSVLERINKISRHDIQRVGLSATVGNPTQILRWLKGSSKRPGRVVDPPKNPSKRELMVVYRDNPIELTQDASKRAIGQKSLFFCQSRAATESVAGLMRNAGVEVFVHHSAVSKEERESAEKNFHQGSNNCIMCTSTLELGIDVGDLDRVLQHNAPDTVSSFLQRMGRTGRREGKSANTDFYCETPDAIIQAVALIQLAKSGWVEDVPTLSRSWSVFVHQILAMCLGGDGARRSHLWEQLSLSPDFSGISEDEFNRVIDFMVERFWLREASGLLVLGPKSERRFGHKNFMELYAVFSSPQSYTVIHGVNSIGTLQQDFVDRLVEDISSFLLGGRAWAVLVVNHKDRQIKVQPAPRGAQPKWGGFLPQFLGYELCRKMADVLASDDDFDYLKANAKECLAQQREQYGLSDRGNSRPWFQQEDFETIWWTFAGGKINATLRYAIEAVTDWKVVPDNFRVCLRTSAARGHDLTEAIATLQTAEFWNDDELWTKIAGSLPEYRLSKFQDVLPPEFAAEMISDSLLDRRGAKAFMLDGPGKE